MPPPATVAELQRLVRRTKRPVWVKLALVYPQLTFPPRRFPHDDHTITIAGDAPGELHAWYRTTSGDWLGLVSFSILYASRMPPADPPAHIYGTKSLSAGAADVTR